MSIDLELCLVERCRDRVRVRILLTPHATCGAVVDEAAVQLVDASGEALCPRLLLPIAGRLTGHVQTSFELRSTSALAEGSQVVASVWVDGAPQQVTIPADPFTRLLDHLQGSRFPAPIDDALLEPLSPDERVRLERVFPWVLQPLRETEPAGVLDAAPAQTPADLASDLGLDEEDAAWLEELLEEP
ncbi:MAG TPA: hypothetical protein PKA64_12230 [Myxococcota bacterium]|nr:hypothetical protein [Myxococcota bacterium]